MKECTGIGSEKDDFEVCTFCGEMFQGGEIKGYQSHYQKCRDGYIEESDDDDKENNFYLYG